MMGNLCEYVRAEGTLDDSKIWRREPLYRGMNGRFVERFYPAKGQSCIFKPLTNGESIDREIWVYRHVLPFFPPIYPQMLATSGEGKGAAGWAIFEDLGALGHAYRLENALKVAQRMAWWHSLPAAEWSGLSMQGPKPGIEAIAAELLDRQNEAAAVLSELGLGQPAGIFAAARAARAGERFGGPRVLSHGDLHQGNYAVTDEGRLYILDWEHAHLSSPFGDLFHLIDMSHPMFAKRMTASDRERILGEYLGQARLYGAEWERRAFVREYGSFAVLFALWMLLLIQSDLKRAECVWPRERLLAQREETAANLAGCMVLMGS
ncbi:phosphotransferase [Paenibacillus macerans]|uniref:Phosphotransferase n=3 Tax=Paenibacillus TaxID=44249 RepID=A0A6N8F2D0_PAEMA|nr:phosphotransferase [Paenibacillus macerans]